MLRIKSLKLTDFGRHKSVEANFDGHVVGLTGSNGLGKSTVLQALQFAYTGTVETEPARPLLNFIRRSSGDNPPKFAEVESTFVVDGKEGRIIRRITRTSITRKLYWDGSDKPITSDKEVSRILEEIMGVDKKAINSTVFIRQGEMASMFKQETERRDFYTRLLMLGHLAKVANVIETHRAHLSGTLQDLGAVRDAADAAYEEAAAYFSSAVDALSASPSQADNLSMARKVLVKFDSRYAAGRDLERAELTVANSITDENDVSVTDWLSNKKKIVKEIEQELAELTNRKTAHINASLAVSTNEKRVTELARIAALFDNVKKVQLQLDSLQNVGDDPGPQIKELEMSLAQLDRRDLLARDLPKRREALLYKMAVLEQHTQLTSAKQEVYDTSRETYSALKSRLDLRRELMKAAQLGDHSNHEGCPLCYSNNEPDIERLRQDIAAEEAKLEEVVASGKVVKETLADMQTICKDASDTLQRDRPRVNEDELELKKLNVSLALTDRNEVNEAIEHLKAQQAVYAVADFERRRLETDLSAAQALIAGKSCPPPEDVDAAIKSLDEAKATLEATPWEDADSDREQGLGAQVVIVRESIATLQRQVSDLESANRSLVAANDELQTTLAELPAGFYDDVLTGAPSLTPAEASAKLEILERHQQEHDSARGRQEAANENLKAASRKVDELALRTAEQKHRLALVKDLEILRDTFKPGGASLEYLNYNFGQIASMAADYLAESGADFMVAASEEIPLSYEFLRTDREDEVWMGQDLLSGGQKVRLAVATLRAIHALIMPNVGLLVLDEPTTHLDDEAKTSMADMLHAIGEEETLQIIVCDHSPILVDAFSDVITLSK
jgi:DNA repair protein SbcC/Rad50